MFGIKKSFARSLYGSPLEHRKSGVLIGLLLIFLSLAGILGNLIRLGEEFYGRSPVDEFQVILSALSLALLAAVPAVLLLRWLDRREPEPWWIYGIALFWGGLMGTGWVMVLHDFLSVPEMLVMISGEVIKENHLALSLAGALEAGLYEELTKAACLLLLIWLLRASIHSMRDGFIIGALVGLGFNIIETSVYILMIYHENGLPPYLSQLIVRYCLLGLDGHAMYAGMTGLGIGYAIQTSRRWGRWLVPPLLFLLAVVAHTAWDTLPAVAETIREKPVAGDASQPAETGAADELDRSPSLAGAAVKWAGLVLLTLVLQGPFILLTILLLVYSGRWERKVLRDELAGEVGSGVVTGQEFAAIQAGRIPAWRTTARVIYNCQAALAMRKQDLRRDGKDVLQDPLAQAWREDIAGLRFTVEG